MNEFLLRPLFYGNTIGDVAIALGILFGSIIVAKILYWAIGKFVKRLTARTKTRLDDIIVDMVEEPLVFGLVIIGGYVAAGRLLWEPAASNFVYGTLGVLVVICIAWMITRLADALIEEYVVPVVEKSDTDLDDQLLPILRKIIKIVVWILAIIIALNNSGYDVGALIAGLGIGGLAFALAAQDTVSNLFGGFTIFADKPFQVNERIIVDGYEGFVREIGVRSTRIETLRGRMVTIPNSNIANNAVTNLSSEPSRKIVQTLGLTYDTPPEKMELGKKILEDIINAHPKTTDALNVSFKSFGDFSMNLQMVYFITESVDTDVFDVESDINFEVLKQFNAAGLDFAFPTQTIFHAQV